MEIVKGQCCSFFGAFAKVYTLSDKSGNVFYVGCTTNRVELRIASHISEARTDKGANKKKNEKIRLLKYEVVVRIVDIKWVTGEKRGAAFSKMRGLEKQWTMKFHRLGYDLCNLDIQRHVIVKPKENPEFIGQTFITKKHQGQVTNIVEELSVEKEAQETTFQNKNQ